MTTDTLEALREAREALEMARPYVADMPIVGDEDVAKIDATLARIDAALAEGEGGLRRCNVCKGLVPTFDAPTTLCGCEYMAPAGTHAALAEGGWRPIETALTDAPHWFSEYDKTEPKTRYISEVLVWGPTWEGGWDHSPYDKDATDMWTGEPDIFIASTWEGAPCWKTSNPGPEDYDQYVRPTHWMPLPASPIGEKQDD